MPSSGRRGGYRWTDPQTAVDSAKTVNVMAREYDVLVLLSHQIEPRNGWEMSQELGWQTISVVPRLAPLRRKGMILHVGSRPGPPPKRKSQMAYIISPVGQRFLADVRRDPSLWHGPAASPAFEEANDGTAHTG